MNIKITKRLSVLLLGSLGILLDSLATFNGSLHLQLTAALLGTLSGALFYNILNKKVSRVMYISLYLCLLSVLFPSVQLLALTMTFRALTYQYEAFVFLYKKN